MACPASPRLSHGIPSTDNKYTSEGTAAHELAARCFHDNCDATHFVGQVINEIAVTSSMANDVQLYLDHCRRLIDPADFHLVEHQISLASLNPPVPMFGTLDFGAYFAKRQEFYIVDFKFGRGTWVSAKDNPQVRYYALGAALSIDTPVTKVIATIIQPRFANAEPIRTVVIDAIELAEWSFELIERAHATREPDAPAVPGDHCKFCPAKGSCLAHQMRRATDAFHEFTLADVHATDT
jgi:hypothetical protein